MGSDTDADQYRRISELEKMVSALQAKQQMLLHLLGGVGLVVATDILARVFG